MAISRTIGIDMPDDFPTTAYDVVNAKLGSYQQRNPNVWTQYAGGWNAIAFRFKTATVADDRFTESIKHFPQPPPLCQTSSRLNRIGTFGGADSRKWLDTDRRTKIG
jgi:hypothetical protein